MSMKPKELKKLTAVLKAIADPTRRAIFNLVLKSDKKESISTVAKNFKITRQGITKHLKMLEEAKLIQLKRIGRVTYCTADGEPLLIAQNWIADYFDTPLEGIKMPLLSAEEVSKVEELVSNTEKLLADIEMQEAEEEEAAEIQLVQMSIDPNDPGQPVVMDLIKPEPVVKEPKTNPIEVTDNQLDIYGIRKEPKVNEDSQLEMF